MNMRKRLWRLASVLLASLTVISLFGAKSDQELRRKIEIVEQRAAAETEFGREMAALIKQQHTPYVLEEDLPVEARYSFIEDKIHYRPLPAQIHKEYLLRGDPVRLQKHFHEEVHRLQFQGSKWGPLLNFIRDHGGWSIEEQDEKRRATFKYAGSAQDLQTFVTGTLGLTIPVGEEVQQVFIRLLERFEHSTLEMKVLRELQAYLSCNTPSWRELYDQLLESGEAEGVSPELFERLYTNVVVLYGYYEADHRRVAQFIGDSESIGDFLSRLRKIWTGKNMSALARKGDAFSLRKLMFREEVKRIAKEILGEEGHGSEYEEEVR